MDNIHNKINNEILGLKTMLDMGKIKIHMLDNVLMLDKKKPYKLRVRILDELIGGYYIMDLVDDELHKQGITNLKCQFHNVKYIPDYMNPKDTLRLFTFCLIAD